MQTHSKKETEINKNAYMLVYERVTPAKAAEAKVAAAAPASVSAPSATVSTPVAAPEPTPEISGAIRQSIEKDNSNFAQDRLAFDPALSAFCFALTQLAFPPRAPGSGGDTPSAEANEAMLLAEPPRLSPQSSETPALPVGEAARALATRLAVQFVMDIGVRAWDTTSFSAWVDQLEQIFAQSPAARVWTLEAFSGCNKECPRMARWVELLLLRCPQAQQREAIVEILLSVIRSTRADEAGRAGLELLDDEKSADGAPVHKSPVMK